MGVDFASDLGHDYRRMLSRRPVEYIFGAVEMIGEDSIS